MPVNLKYLPANLKLAAEKFDFTNDGILDARDFQAFTELHQQDADGMAFPRFQYSDTKRCVDFNALNRQLGLPTPIDCHKIPQGEFESGEFMAGLFANSDQVIQKLSERLQPKWNTVSRFKALEYGLILFLDYYIRPDRIIKEDWPYSLINKSYDDHENVHLRGAIQVHDRKTGMDETRTADIMFDFKMLNSGQRVMEHFMMSLNGETVLPQDYPDVMPDLLRPTELFFGKAGEKNWELLSQGLIPFDNNQSKLNPTAMVYLDTLAQVMTEYPSLHFEITGHADRTGTGKHNIALGKKRAQAVKTYLIDLLGPAAEPRLTTISQGESGALEQTQAGEASYYNRNAQMRAYSTTELPHADLATLPRVDRVDNFVSGTAVDFHGKRGFEVHYLSNTLTTDVRKTAENKNDGTGRDDRPFCPPPLPSGIKVNDS